LSRSQKKNEQEVNNIPSINLSKPYYDEIIRMGLEPREVANELVAKFIEEKHGAEKSQ